MFPICHIYFTNKVMGELSEATVLGCISPDIVLKDMIGRKITHYNTGNLYSFFKNREAVMKEFALGAVCHGVDMKGLDYYSDEKYPGMDNGYCFEKAKLIEEDVIRCCSIPPEWGLWKGHNFIEMAFEMYLYGENTWIASLFGNAFKDNELIEKIAVNLGEYYDKPAGLIYESFKKFMNYIEYKDINACSLMKKYSFQLEKKHGIKNADIGFGMDILNTSLDIIRQDGECFFEYTTKQVEEVIKSIS